MSLFQIANRPNNETSGLNDDPTTSSTIPTLSSFPPSMSTLTTLAIFLHSAASYLHSNRSVGIPEIKIDLNSSLTSGMSLLLETTSVLRFGFRILERLESEEAYLLKVVFRAEFFFFLEITPTELVTVLQEACKICQFANPSGCDLTIFGRCNETFVSRMLLTRAEFRAPAATRSAKGAQIDIDHQTMLHWTMRYLGCNSSTKSTRFWFQRLLIVMKRCLSSRKERKNLK
ncbi:unnamed protein product [Nesidiocoris tenuis]|uniref:Uncharacterized protein n=1 Tax=Nesidiocoris tenuis TaxID=355587 RepID=A0A6H5FUJ7_9HEMI|nr:unnamed protein product [Nesidiocoris tenuis]